ncbi:uncharacterized protein LOC116340834 [Contarinia nasturtii]|uniref:uncharacterized protein LOC116340834 n=1 Tax=Contarinia nasturtii TaxID=265458 RepID=UPI0012D3791A|nr:uncharacterized protein LOC116340834 [Contarinia nasturtii]
MSWNKDKMKFLSIAIFIATIGLAFATPLPQSKPGASAGGAAGADGMPIQWLMNAMPRSGLAGMADNIGAGLANFGNGQGSAFDAMLSGLFSAVGNLLSGILGSGAVNTAFLNYNNRPPPDTGAPTTPKPAAGGGGGGDDGGGGDG